MKKIYSLLIVVFVSVNFLFAGGGCVIDSANTQFFYPRPDSLPCVERNLPYNQVIQIAVPVSIDLQDFGSPFPFILYVDSVVITGANGLPNGITYQANPANGVLYGGGYGCALVTGTTTDAAGRYPVTFNGTFTAHGQAFPPFFDGDTTIDFSTLASQAPEMFNLYLDVVEQGTTCDHVALDVNDFSANLNAALAIYPNPGNGVFVVKLNSERKIAGEIAVIDITGKKVFSQQIDISGLFSTTINLQNCAKGIYTLQLRTEEGFAAKNISIE